MPSESELRRLEAGAWAGLRCLPTRGPATFSGCSRGPAEFSAGPSLAPVCGKGYKVSPYAQLCATADGAWRYPRFALTADGAWRLAAIGACELSAGRRQRHNGRNQGRRLPVPDPEMLNLDRRTQTAEPSRRSLILNCRPETADSRFAFVGRDVPRIGRFELDIDPCPLPAGLVGVAVAYDLAFSYRTQIAMGDRRQGRTAISVTRRRQAMIDVRIAWNRQTATKTGQWRTA